MTPLLPRESLPARVPPIKCQGIKTKLVPFIATNVRWDGRGRWVEPFLGSGVVAFSLAPDRALLADSNPHLIRFYSAVAGGEIDALSAREFLTREGARLHARGEAYYYEVRDRFNAFQEPLDFLFLNRACFNGLIRFNRRGAFNVPFNRKPQRFAPAYITKICNQIDRLAATMAGKCWEFVVADWKETVARVGPGDFVYADPPYIGRFSDYFNAWDDDESSLLLDRLCNARADFAVSTWSHNKYRTNRLLLDLPPQVVVKTVAHFYHLGSTEQLRNEMTEALVISASGAASACTAESLPAIA